MTTEEPTSKKAKRETCSLLHCRKVSTTQCIECQKVLCNDCSTACAGGYKESETGEISVDACTKVWCPKHAARVARRCYRNVQPDRSPPQSPLRYNEFHEANSVFCSKHSTKCYLCPIVTCEFHEIRDKHDEDSVAARMYSCDRCGEVVCAHCSTQCGCDRNECKKCVNPRYMLSGQDYMCKWCRDENRRGAWVDGDTSDEENGRLDKDGKFIKKPSEEDDDTDT